MTVIWPGLQDIDWPLMAPGCRWIRPANPRRGEFSKQEEYGRTYDISRAMNSFSDPLQRLPNPLREQKK